MRRHHLRGSRGPRRKIRWYGAEIYTNSNAGNVTLTSGHTASAWIKWPSGYPNTNLLGDPYEPVDETLIRMFMKGYITFHDNNSNGIAFFSFGVIAWDTVNPGALDKVILGAGNAPDPNDLTKEWILRTTYINTAPGLSDFQFFYPTLDKEFESRAQRKLPEGTGLLGVVSVVYPENDTFATQVDFGVQYRYAVKQP